MWPSGGQTRVAGPLAARCSTFGGGRSDLGDLVTGGGRGVAARCGFDAAEVVRMVEALAGVPC